MSIKFYAIMYCCMQLFWLSTLIFCDVTSASNGYIKTIETNSGPVRGRRGTTLLDNISYYSFKGIPYAKAPTGSLRFKVNIKYTTIYFFGPTYM